mmetsp:Transcript_5119/g.5253  ORF Transcript_5119/g.5253 Transcript_5119/m.5253 type:complete len:325 (-) Transcript_5119:61-1035(-)
MSQLFILFVLSIFTSTCSFSLKSKQIISNLKTRYKHPIGCINDQTNSANQDGLSTTKAVRYFINLTNGIEAVSMLLKQGVPMEHINYFRLQSTHCEMRNYEGILENLDYNLLMHLALGYVCVVYDYGSRGNSMGDDEREGIPRAFWWGTEWIRYVLDNLWHLEDEGKEVYMVRGYNSKKIFENQMKLLPKSLKRRIKYFRTYLKTNKIHLYPVYSKTDKDGEREYYAALLLEQAHKESSDLKVLEDMSRDDVDDFIKNKILSDDMSLYKSTDFEGFGRALGYGTENISENITSIENKLENVSNKTVEPSSENGSKIISENINEV